MGSDLTNAFAIYPMVEEHEATGRVAGVYNQILESMPFVPSLFKSLATCPGYLVLAWDQASHALADAAFVDRAAALSAMCREASVVPKDEQVREVLRRFVRPLGRMLLLSAGLLEALEGRVPGIQSRAQPASPSEVRPKTQVPSQWDIDASSIYGEIRQALVTPIVNSIWRALAGEGLLEHAWASLGPQVATSKDAAERLQDRAISDARSYRWPMVAGPAALEAAGVADAAPAQAAILDAYVKTLPRLLALVASSDTDDDW
jgi:hypothetical protein